MYYVEKIFSDITLDISLLPKEFDAKSSIFFDIETSGLSPKSSPVFLIGLVFFNNQEAVFRQYFSNSVEEEIDILNAFIDDVNCFKTIYHFNGLSFDIPFINERLSHHGIKYRLDKSSSFDIYQFVKKHKEMLNLESCKLKSVEEYMGIFREDDLSGKEIVDAYKKYLNTKSHFLRDKMLLHNEEDILNLYKILPIIKMIDSKKMKSQVEVSNYSISFSEKAVLVEGKYDLDDEKNIEWSNEDMNFKWKSISKSFKLEYILKKDILYYFFKDYKNYYYFPELDQAVHKSVAKYYRFEEKHPASRSNCYIKQSHKYIKLPFELEGFEIKLCRIEPDFKDYCIPLEEIKKYKDSDIIRRIIIITIQNITGRL